MVVISVWPAATREEENIALAFLYCLCLTEPFGAKAQSLSLCFPHICPWKKLKLVICLCLLHLQVELLKWSSTSFSTTWTGTACWGRRLSLFPSWSLKMTPATSTVSQKYRSINNKAKKKKKIFSEINWSAPDNQTGRLLLIMRRDCKLSV